MDYTILICTHNRCMVLPRALDAVAALKTPPGKSMELIVVENASTDQTAAVVEEFGRRAAFPVRCLREDRLGHSFALNTGIAAARGEIVAFTDDDALPMPDWLLELERMFREHDADFAFGRVYPVWEQEIPRWFSEHFYPHLALLDYGSEILLITDANKPFNGVNHAVKRSTLQDLGGFREDLGLYGTKGGIGNDHDLFQRAQAADARILYNPAAQVGHLIEPCRYRKGYWRKKTWTSTAYQYAFLQSNPPPVPLLLGLPRYYYRLTFAEALRYFKYLLARDRSLTFYHELRLLRFLGLMYQSCRKVPDSRL